MQNRVTVTVAGHNYTLLAEEGEDYVRRVADFVNEQMRQTQEGTEISQLDCALLTCLNIADQYAKDKVASANLRQQIKNLLEENAQLKLELHQTKHPARIRTPRSKGEPCMMEILSPAGSPEAVRAAVYAGADAVYLGYGPFNARRNARNFSREELEEAIRLCHLYGVKVYLTLNTLASDREVAQAAQVAVEASSLGVDAILVQDMGLLQVVRKVAPDVHLHASTQMTIHNLDGVKRCADLGSTLR